MSIEERDKSEDLARDLFEAEYEARERIEGQAKARSWCLIAETDKAIYRAMANRALRYEEVERMTGSDVDELDDVVGDIEDAVNRAMSSIRRIRNASRKGITP